MGYRYVIDIMFNYLQFSSSFFKIIKPIIISKLPLVTEDQIKKTLSYLDVVFFF